MLKTLQFSQWSISRRLSLWYSLTILVLLGAFAIVTFINFTLTIHADFDQHLRHETQLLLAVINLDGTVPALDSDHAYDHSSYQTTGIYATYVRLISLTGLVQSQSPNFSELGTMSVELPGDAEERTMSRDRGDTPIRTLYHPLVGQDGGLQGWLEVSGFEWAVHQQLDWLARTYLLGIIISTLLAFGGGYLLARRALRPVDEITKAAKEIRASDLGARLPTRFGVNDEITRLAETINNLLARLEESIKRELRFISNATHELMTPLTTLRGELDLARNEKLDPETLEVLNLALDDIDRMGHIIRSLLTLSRVERLTTQPRQTVDIGTLCGEHLERFRDRAEVRKIEMTVSSETELMISADPVHIGTVVDNLVDNALKYTPDGGSIQITAVTVGDCVRITVQDTGHGFTDETAKKLFDRFYRSDDPNIQQKPGSGLGLAIAHAITRAYGGEMTATSTGLGQGAMFEVEFPRGS